MHFGSREEAVLWIEGQRRFGKKSGLDNMNRLLAAMGDPQKRLRFIHVAGTNGKGSVCAMLESACRECFTRTGMYTSPYLEIYNERMRINGEPVSDDQIVLSAQKVHDIIERSGDFRPTVFEIGTAMACDIFLRNGCDPVIWETGLGGRLDPTNAVTPIMSVITSIGMDHMGLLGDTISEIAKEKAGIIKQGIPVVIYAAHGDALQVLTEEARARHADITAVSGVYKDISRAQSGYRFTCRAGNWGSVEAMVPLNGRHQIENASLALTALERLSAIDSRFEKDKCIWGIAKTVWPGRMELIKGNILLDGAHNAHAAEALAKYMEEEYAGRKSVLLTAMMKDKDCEGFARTLAPFVSHVVTAELDGERSLSAMRLKEIYADLGVNGTSVADPLKALDFARSLANGSLLLITGSLYLVGQMRSVLTK